MRYYIIGNKDSEYFEYDYATEWLLLNGHTVINPFYVRISGINEKELLQIKAKLLSFAGAVLVLDRSCETYELGYAKALGKKVKYLSKQWRLKRKESRTAYDEENAK